MSHKAELAAEIEALKERVRPIRLDTKKICVLVRWDTADVRLAYRGMMHEEPWWSEVELCLRHYSPGSVPLDNRSYRCEADRRFAVPHRWSKGIRTARPIQRLPEAVSVFDATKAQERQRGRIAQKMHVGQCDPAKPST
jgi:hypothetical protein